MKKRTELNQLSKRQKDVLLVALRTGESSGAGDTVFDLRMKQLLLRAFAIHKRRDRLSASTLSQYRCDFKRRLKQCMALQPDHKLGMPLKRFYPKLPYYLLLLLTEEISTPTAISSQQIRGMNTVYPQANSLSSEPKNQLSLSRDRIPWITWSRLCLAVCTKNPKIVKLKKALGCISLIPIKVRNEPVKVRGVWLNYHDLYHLEVAQLERIQMGKNMVSGIHGINRRVFHNFPIVEEYDSFLDEARIAIHEWLTRPSAFSQLKAICWMILLMLQGINPFSVVSRHIKSLKKKQQELWFFANS